MPGQLIFSCPKCGIKVRVPADHHTIRCACGYRQWGSSNLEADESLHMPEERRQRCVECEKFGNYRCSEIDRGCRRTFLDVANDPQENCPLGKWMIP
ncbi:MAG: hypothetical protein ACYC4U_11440 [Pirellulaceae bacterium]